MNSSPAFESYNARFIDPQTVAETFVLRENEFRVLCEQNNSLLIGARGSGKTTLLKMLKVGAQVAWKNKRQAKILRQFRFAPIYAGADRQLDLVVSGLELDAETKKSVELISKALLSFRVKFACLDTMKEITDPKLRDVENLSHQYVQFGNLSETFCKALSSAWSLDEIAHSPLEINARLQWQLAEVNKYLSPIKYGERVSVTSLISAAQFITHDPITSCQAFISTFNEIIGASNKIWALCIDELEIMPSSLQRYLFSCFRSIDQRIVLKLATSPFSSIDWGDTSIGKPMAGHDFTPINLTFVRKSEGRRNEARRFSTSLFDAMIVAEGNVRPSGRPSGADVLRRSPIAEANTLESQRSAYRPPDGLHYLKFKRLKETDVAFRQFLSDRGVDLDKAHLENEDKKAAQLRKLIWPVSVRLEFGPTNQFVRRDKSTGERSPSRKSVPDIYLGFDSLITMCEGNPRATIALMRPFARRYWGRSAAIPFEEQGYLVEDAIRKYISLLSAIKLSDPYKVENNLSVVSLIERIGEYFSREINGSLFKSEPISTFIVDKMVPREYVEAIGAAMNQGAFVMISDEDSLFDFGALRQARVRLSYLLSPLYHLPLTMGGVMNLSNLLGKGAIQRRTRTLNQRDLFGENSNE